MNEWLPIASAPKYKGHYLVANSEFGYVLSARYLPRNNEWRFASANQAFHVTHWMPLPEPPEKTK